MSSVRPLVDSSLTVVKAEENYHIDILSIPGLFRRLAADLEAGIIKETGTGGVPVKRAFTKDKEGVIGAALSVHVFLDVPLDYTLRSDTAENPGASPTLHCSLPDGPLVSR
jgi:hypothetical protein